MARGRGSRCCDQCDPSDHESGLDSAFRRSGFEALASIGASGQSLQRGVAQSCVGEEGDEPKEGQGDCKLTELPRTEQPCAETMKI
jgi:hypothetical protein